MTDQPTHTPTPRPNGPIGRAVALLCLVFIRLYQVTLSPLLGGHCRFHPTCSRYAAECFQTLPAHRALWLTIRRVLRCHPFGPHGYDPPPTPTSDEASQHINQAQHGHADGL